MDVHKNDFFSIANSFFIMNYLIKNRSVLKNVTERFLCFVVSFFTLIYIKIFWGVGKKLYVL